MSDNRLDINTPGRIGNDQGASAEPVRPAGETGKKSILVIESERLSTMRKVIARTAASEYAENARISVICNNSREKFYRSFSPVDKVIPYPGKGLFSKIFTAIRILLRTEKTDLLVAILNGEKQFRKSKILFWLLRARDRLIFDGHLDYFLLDKNSRGRVLSKKRWKAGKARIIDVLVFETDAIEIIREVIRTTRDQQIIPRARITVFCRQSSVDFLQGFPSVKNIIAYRDNSPGQWFKKAFSTIFRRHTVIVGVLNGRQRFFFSKLLFCLCRNRHRLVFNGSLDCCFWNRHTYGQIIAQGLKAGVHSPFADNPRKVLALETAAPDIMKRIILTASDPKVNPNARVVLFCNETRAEEFNGFPAIEKIVTYSDKSLKEKVSTSAKLAFTYPDAVVARFNGSKVFMPMKFLFWLVRTPNRIVFNETLDCFYLNRKTLGMLLMGNRQNMIDSFLAACLRKMVKTCLFLPRFGFLLAWRGVTLLGFRMKN